MEYSLIAALSAAALALTAPLVGAALAGLEEASCRSCLLSLSSAVEAAASEALARGRGEVVADLPCEVRVGPGPRASCGPVEVDLSHAVRDLRAPGAVGGRVSVVAVRSEGGVVAWLRP